MAKLGPQGDLKLAINGSRVHVGGEAKDSFRISVNGGGRRRFLESSVGVQKSCRGIRFPGFGSVCSVGKKASRSSAAERLNADGDDIKEEEEDGYEKDELSCFRGLVLDISYRPVNVVCWRRAICLEFMEKVDVLEYYDQTVSSPNGSFYIPAVLRVPHLLQVIKRRRIKHCVSRKNIFYRDDYACQYRSSWPSQSLQPAHFISQAWSRPPSGQVKLNVDAACTVPEGRFAVVVRDSDSRFIEAYCRNFLCSSSLEAEGLAILMALRLLQRRVFLFSIIESDALEVVNFILLILLVGLGACVLYYCRLLPCWIWIHLLVSDSGSFIDLQI